MHGDRMCVPVVSFWYVLSDTLRLETGVCDNRMIETLLPFKTHITPSRHMAIQQRHDIDAFFFWSGWFIMRTERRRQDGQAEDEARRKTGEVEGTWLEMEDGQAL